MHGALVLYADNESWNHQSNPNMNFLNQMKGIAAPILLGGQTVFFSVWNNLTIELLDVSK